MRTLHKLTHRPLALGALFLGLGVLGWHLPQFGAAVLAYSTSAVQTVRTTLTAAPSGSVATPGVAKSNVTLAPRATAQQTPAQQAVTQARTALEAAQSAAKANPHQGNKQGDSAVEVALANYNAAVAQRLAEIRARLSQLEGPSGGSNTDTGNGPVVPSEYHTLLAEVQSYGGFPQVATAPATNEVNELEPNDTSATANTLTGLDGANQVLVLGRGVINAGNEDWWRITGAPAGSKLWAFIDTGGSSAQFDSVMELRAADGTTIIEADDDGASATNGGNTVLSISASAIAGRTLTAGGTYFLRVDTFSATANITSYKLYVYLTTAATAETEANETSATANDITPTAADRARVRTGAIGSASDVDFYSVTVAANSTLVVNLDANPEKDASDTDVVVTIFDTNGTTPLLTIDGTPNGFSIAPESEATSNLRVAAGTYFIRVSPFSSADTGTYALSVAVASPTVNCPPDTITATLGGASNFPKVTGTTTHRLFRDGTTFTSQCGVARTQTAPLTAARTYDAYTLAVGGTGTQCFNITLTKTDAATAEPMAAAYLNSFNPTNLTQNWLGDIAVSITPAGVNVPFTFGVNVPAGNNIVIVVMSGGGAAGTNGGYSLKVQGQVANCPCTMLTCPANITANVAAGTCAATVTYATPTTSGSCSVPVCTPPSGSSFPVGTTTVTCTAQGSTGPQTCSFMVTVVDNIPPTIACPPNQFVGTSGVSAVPNYPLPTVADNCPFTTGNGTPVCTPPPNAAFPLGVTTVNCSVTDAAGLTSTCNFQVTVNRVVAGSLTDPLACTGPGNLLNGSFTVTNTGAVTQSVAATVTPSVGLSVISGTCTVAPASAGTCALGATPNTFVFNGSLAAGAAATVSYRLQVNNGVSPGNVLSTVISASFNGGPPATASASITATCPLAGPGAPFIGATAEQTVMSDQRAGSVLIYPIYTSDAANGNAQNARISITNTHPILGAFVHLFFIDGSTCSVSDAFVCLTQNQTSTFLMSDLDPGTTGYVIAVASDPTGCPVQFNYLIGDEYVKFASGHQANLGAEAIPGISGSPFWVSCNSNSVTATLPFDGITYGRVPATLALDNIPSPADGNNTLLIIDRIGGDLQTGPARLGPIFGVLYDDAEIAYSFNLPTNNLCQFRSTLGTGIPRTTPPFPTVIPSGRSGWMKFAGTSDFGIVGAVINQNPNLTTASGAFRGGHNLHKLTFTSSTTLVIPIFPPTC